MGPETVTEYTGSIGDVSKVLDMFDSGEFFNSIMWREVANRPCQIGVAPREMVNLGAALAFEDFHCGTGDALSQTTQVSVAANTWVHAVQVCNNRRNSNYRLKGIRLWGARINDDGTLTTDHNSDTESHSNCSDWAPRRACPSNQLATGVVVLANEAGGEDRSGITALRLICHTVEMGGAP